VLVTAEQCPRISSTFLEEERRTMPRQWFDSEYNCLFVATVDSLFSYEDIQAALADDSILPLFTEAPTWQ
jgi:hypothetical protein